MGAGVEFRVLGPVEVWTGEGPVRLGGAKTRAVLAALLLSAGRVVPATTLIDLIWGDHPPASAPALVQTYVSTLRKRLVQGGVGADLIRTRAPGYVLTPDPAALDSRRFEDLVTGARHRQAGRDLLGAAESYRAALALWRGPALGGVGDALRAEAAGLEEQRLTVLEERIAVDLALGREAELGPEVRALCAENPLRERLIGYLMTVLYRLGRQGEALAVFEAGRRTLADELGIDPGPELTAVHAAVLRADQAALAATDRGTPRGGPVEAAPAPVEVPPPPVAQLPPAVADFTGRADAVAGLLAGLRPPGPGVPVCVIAGQGGSGKSALAVRVAHDLVADFPDGQVYVELRGMSDAPAAPEDVLARLLRDFGVTPDGRSSDLEELSARYRSRLAGRRVLVVLDDAADERQVRPLLPGTAGSAVLVTSRNRLAGLAGATLTELAVLTAGEGVDLLTRIIGVDRVRREPAAAQRLIALCGHLPLAIRVAGARLASRPGWSLGLLVHRLTDELHRLDELAVGDQEVRAGTELSYRSLPEPAGRALRLLGVLGLSTFCSTTMATLTGTSPRAAEDAIEQLIDAQLVQDAGPDGLGRMIYRVHDLVRVFGRERAEAQDSTEDRLAAVRRVLGSWIWLLERISTDAPTGEILLRHTYRQAVEPDPALAAPILAAPRAWFEAEEDAFVAAVERAAALDLVDLAGELASALTGSVFLLSNRLQAWSRTHAAAIQAARRAGDTHGEARLLVELGELRYAEDRYLEALDCLGKALVIFQETGDRQGELSALAFLGATSRELGRLRPAVAFLDDAHGCASRLGDAAGLGQVHRLRGSVRLELGELELAAADLDASLSVYRSAGSRRGEAFTVRTLSLLHRARGEFDQAETRARQALAIFREVGDELAAAYSLQAWAKARLRQGHPDGLAEDLTAALAVSRRLGDRFGAGLHLRTLGELYLVLGRLDEARTCFTEAISLWEVLGLPLFRARTARDVARLQVASGDPVAAAATRAQALVVFQEHEAREATELAAEMAGDPDGPALTARP